MSDFEDYVSGELPKRPHIPIPVGGNLEAAKFLKTTGNGMQVELADGGSGGGVNGGAFISDIVPTGAGNVGTKVTSSDGNVLDSCLSDTDEVTVHVLVVTGNTHYKPVISINGTDVTNLTESADSPIWTGSIDITLAGDPSEDITILHEDGATTICTVDYAAPPVVTAALFTGSYPGSQTELKENDTFSLAVTADQDVVEIETQNFEACKAGSDSFAATTTKTILVTIAYRGTTTQDQAGRVRVKTAEGSWSDWYDTDTTGTVNGVNIVKLNNRYPSISFDSIVYPVTQAALKDSEQATINTTLANYDTFLHTYPTAQLSEVSADANSVVVQRIAGDYNISSNNISISCTRNANAATTVSATNVKIAHTFATLAVTEPAARLRSGGNAGTSAQNHTIAIAASQQLTAAPTLVAPVGTWQGAGFIGGPTNWNRALQIHDNDSKGVNAWGAILGTNLAGKVTIAITGDSNYTTGGFVFRTMTIAAWTNREGAIGTQVSDVTKLRCSNLSKGASGSLNFTYRADTTNTVDEYTITQPTTVANPAGNLWYNCDQSNAVSNTAGTMQVEFEEII